MNQRNARPVSPLVAGHSTRSLSGNLRLKALCNYLIFCVHGKATASIHALSSWVLVEAEGHITMQLDLLQRKRAATPLSQCCLHHRLMKSSALCPFLD
jgi:hypothetical protein